MMSVRRERQGFVMLSVLFSSRRHEKTPSPPPGRVSPAGEYRTLRTEAAKASAGTVGSACCSWCGLQKVSVASDQREVRCYVAGEASSGRWMV